MSDASQATSQLVYPNMTNFMDSSYIEKDGVGFLDSGIFVLPLSGDMNKIIKERAKSSELILGIRPEDVSLHKKQNSQEMIGAQVYMIEPLGSEIIVDVMIDKNLLKVRTPPDTKLKMGEKIWGLLSRKIGYSFLIKQPKEPFFNPYDMPVMINTQHIQKQFVW